MENIKNIKKVVENVLESDDGARVNDTWLIIKTLRAMGFNISIDYKINMPSFESITRCRRLIQNKEGRFLPIDKVIKNREVQEEKFRRGINRI